MSPEQDHTPARKKSIFARGGTDHEKTQRLLAGGGISMAALIVGGALMIGWLALMTRWLGSENFGVFTPFYKSFVVAVSIVTLQINVAISVFVAHHWETNPAESRKFVTMGLWLLTGISGAVAAATAALSLFLFLTGNIAPWLFWCLVFYALTLFTNSVFLGFNSCSNAFQRLDFLAYASLANMVGIAAFSIPAVIFIQHSSVGGPRFVVVGPMFGFFMGGLLAMIASMAFFSPASGGRLKLRDVLRVDREPGMARRILAFGGLAAVANMGFAVAQMASPILLGLIARQFHWLGADEAARFRQVGMYGAAMDYSMAAMILAGLTLALVPAVSEAQSQNRKQLMQRYYALAMKCSFIIGAVFVVIYAEMGGAIATALSGEREYPIRVMAPLMSVLGFGNTAMALFFVAVNMLFAVKRPAAPALITVVLAGVEAVIVVLVVRYTGSIFAAGWAFFGVAAVGLGVCLAYIHFAAGLKLPLHLAAAPAVAGLGAWALVRFGVPPTTGFPAWELAVAVGAFFLIYMLLGGLDRLDLEDLGLTGPGLAARVVRRIVALSPFYGVWTGER